MAKPRGGDTRNSSRGDSIPTSKKSGHAERLTPKQRAFVREYLIDHNATQAAIRAGYASGKSAETIGPRLLGNVWVAEAIRRAEEARNAVVAAELDVSKRRVTGAAARLAFADIGDLMEVVTKDDGTRTVQLRDLMTLTPEQRFPIQAIKVSAAGVVEVRLADKRQSVRDLAELLGYVVQKRETRAVKGLEDLSDEELAALEIDIARKLGQGKTPH